MYQDRAMLGKNAPRTQQALRRIVGAMGSLVAGISVLKSGVLIGVRTGLDFGDGFEVGVVDPATVDFPQQVTTAQRLAMTPRTGTLVFDTDQSLHFGYNGVVWAEV